MEKFSKLLDIARNKVIIDSNASLSQGSINYLQEIREEVEIEMKKKQKKLEEEQFR